MIGMVITPSGAPDDARMLAWDQLRKLKDRIALAARATPDAYTRVHLDESLMRINRALNATQTIGSGGGQGAGGILILRGEGAEPAPAKN